MRAVSLHPDVIVAWSRVWQTTCTLVRGPARGEPGDAGAASEAFLIDSPVYPDELELLPALAAQASFDVVGLLATHADWDHVLGPLAFAQAPLGCAPSSAARLRAHPGAAQRELRGFDDEHYVQRPAPLSLGATQALDVPGRCEVGGAELELHATAGHTADGMAIAIPWARVLVVGDYLSAVEIPMLGDGGAVDDYLATLERLRALLEQAEHVVTGHGPVLGREQACGVLDADAAYLAALARDGAGTPLPRGRRSAAQQVAHQRNVAALAAPA